MHVCVINISILCAYIYMHVCGCVVDFVCIVFTTQCVHVHVRIPLAKA